MAGCVQCGHQHIAHNSCKNRHCPKCQGPAARDWMAARAADLLPVECFDIVFTMPTEIAQVAYWNKRAVYDLLFRTSAETVLTIAADSRRIGAKVGMTAVLHTWGSALSHHPHNLRRAWGPLNLENYADKLARTDLDLQFVFATRETVVLPELSRQPVAKLKTAGVAPGMLELNCGHYSLSRPPYVIWTGLSVLRLLSRSQRSVL